MKLKAFLLSVALLLPAMAQADDKPAPITQAPNTEAQDDGCDFAPPLPLLMEQAYPGQTFTATADHSAVETAVLGGGVVLTIYLNQCVDAFSRDFVLTVPNDVNDRDFAAWADFAQVALRDLKVRHAMETNELVAFLKKARAMTPKSDTISMCRHADVAVEFADECGWDSGGSFSLEVKPGNAATQVTVSESLSG